tara:strand:- start:231 stop:1031 length:801 start_codon:yes stop_codon:yes gene_type:complete
MLRKTFFLINGKNMKVIILAGGFGSRLSEYTESIPKPMVKIGNKPILFHIMNYYYKFGFKEFIIALGYKSEIIKEYFLNYSALNSSFTINLKNNNIQIHSKIKLDWTVSLVDTGLNTMTGGRLLRLKEYIGKNNFMLTYGDGLSNIDISKLNKFHRLNKKIVTVSAVRPIARFGELNIKNDHVKSFQEKPQISDGWINGGFFVMEPEFLNLIKNDETILEKEPLEKAVKMKELSAYKHEGFWQCMDTKRDRDRLEEIYNSGSAPWI